MKLSEREIELIDGMIDVQLYHAERCDSMPNRTMADKQKGYDMERVELLRKIKAQFESATRGINQKGSSSETINNPK